LTVIGRIDNTGRILAKQIVEMTESWNDATEFDDVIEIDDDLNFEDASGGELLLKSLFGNSDWGIEAVTEIYLDEFGNLFCPHFSETYSQMNDTETISDSYILSDTYTLSNTKEIQYFFSYLFDTTITNTIMTKVQIDPINKQIFGKFGEL